MSKSYAVAALVTAVVPTMSWAQVPFDPPTAQRAAPNVLLIMDSTRTTLINGETCRGRCHVEDNGDDTGSGGEHDGNIYDRGETRLQLARRVLTGGWGWNTAAVGPSGPADAAVRRDGVMDQYFVRWGLIYYDGLGPRLALNPTVDNALAQQRVIDFAQPGFGEDIGNDGNDYVSPALNSYLPHYRTTRCCGNSQAAGPGNDGSSASTPVYNEAVGWDGRMTRALQYARDYLNSSGPFPQWTPGPDALAAFGAPPTVPTGNFFRGDVANVLQSSGLDGCRRNFVILLTDGHGHQNYAGQSRGEVAAQIHNMTRNDGTAIDPDLRNQVFAVHFGVADKPAADTVADCGFDGVCDAGQVAFPGAPGGAITDLTPMYAAFTAIFQLVLSGDYLASPPTITRSGDRVVVSNFRIQNCQSANPNQCNIGRIGSLRMDEIVYPTADSLGEVEDSIRFSDILRVTRWNNRNVFTSINTDGTVCGRAASCGSATRAAWTSVEFNTFPGNGPPTTPATGTDAEFLRGAPDARFANGVMRSDTSNGLTAPIVGRSPYKLMDIANSQPVVVGAPSGIGEDLERWEAFLGMSLSRNMQTLEGGSADWRPKRGTYPSGGMTVADRDQVVYIGGNDGMLHAFLAGRASGSPGIGRTANYAFTGADVCPSALSATEFPAEGDVAGCLGMELWAYSPRLVQSLWPSIRSGHYFMVDGTPVVSDVLFTKRTATPGATCRPADGLHSGACTNRWEYRTVLLQCLGGGGPGCFALDVTNPYRPEILWERSLNVAGVTRGTSTSRPQIVRVRRTVAGQTIPYYVGIMGGGLGEASAGTRRGSIIAVGLEDGDWYASTGAEVASADFAGAPSCLDVDGDSYTDTCYIATTDAKIYKIRIGSLNPGVRGVSAALTMERFFDGRERLLATGRPASVANVVRAYGRVVATFDRNRDIKLFFATGNFEDMQNYDEYNFMFEVQDTTPEAALSAWSVAANNSRAGSTCNSGPNSGVIALPHGEKSVFDPVISNGVVVFTSYEPSSNPCRVGTGYLNGVSVDTCNNGIDSDDLDTNPDQGVGATRTEFANSLPLAPVINERTGGITVATQTETGGSVESNQGFTRRLPAPPVSKLWWRVMR